jgi:6,7-dimethyl-8-ribityllumazine synthase
MAQSDRRPARPVDVAKARVLMIEAPYYAEIATALSAGAKRALEGAGAQYDTFAVPGALEIPIALAIALDAAEARRRPYDGAVVLGCVIRGETHHFDIVANESARALMGLAVARRLPLGNGILTVETQAQAMARAALEAGDKGGEAARAALALIALKRRVEGA